MIPARWMTFLLVLVIMQFGPNYVWSQEKAVDVQPSKNQMLETKMQHIETNQQKILQKQDEILKKLDQLRTWVRRR